MVRGSNNRLSADFRSQTRAAIIKDREEELVYEVPGGSSKVKVEGPAFKIGNIWGSESSGKSPNSRRLGLKEVSRNFSHSGMKDDISGPVSVIVFQENFPLNSNIRYRPNNVIQSLILGISLSLDILTLTPAGIIKGTPARLRDGLTLSSDKSRTRYPPTTCCKRT